MHRFHELPDEEKVSLYERLGHKALASYGLEDAPVRCLKQGESVVFEVGSSSSEETHFALRLCSPDQDLDALKRELLWLSAIRRDTGLEVPEPILARTGDFYRMTSVEGVPGRHAAVLFRWVGGTILDEDLSRDHTVRLGRWIATLHNHARGFGWPIELEPMHIEPSNAEAMIDEALLADCLSSAEIDVFRDAAVFVSEALVSLGSGPESAGPIHGRIKGQNILFGEDTLGVIGFSGCTWGRFLGDVAVTCAWLAKRQEGEILQDALLGGYGSVRDLPENLPEILRVFGAYGILRNTVRELGGNRPSPDAPRPYRLEQALARLQILTHAE